MGLVNVAKCDVYGGFRYVEQYEITLRRVGDLDGVPVQVWSPYLSNRALKRAIHFIEWAVKKRPRKNAKVV